MNKSIAPREELARLLGGERARRRHGWVDLEGVDLTVAVEGIGLLPRHIPRPLAVKLLALGEPAAYGKGEETLTDPAVRHTWRIPDELVSVDWGGGLDQVLESARSALGLPPGTRLNAQFHSMLVYEVGQFFVPHQDSEKADDMVGTLVVVLGSAHSGGELVVHDGDRETAYRGEREHATAVVLYADQLHEVRPVKTGHRITLTFNILAQRQEFGSAPTDQVSQATELIGRHFVQRPRPRWPGDDDVALPERLAFLLDHHYTEHSLTWSRLKGVDIERAAMLRIAAACAGCEIVLGLCDIHETRDAGDDWRDDDPEDSDESILVRESVVTHWSSRGEGDLDPVTLALGDDEICATTPTMQLRPYESEYEGFMGNYGNTMDRWYHRAVVLMWPWAKAFANRAEADPVWAIDDLQVRLEAGATGAVRDDIAGMAHVWPQVVRVGGVGLPLARILEISALADDAATARILLAPFAIGHVTPELGVELSALTRRYGEPWVGDLLTAWFDNGRSTTDDAWFLALPELCAALDEHAMVGREILRRAWARLSSRVPAHVGAAQTSWGREQLRRLIRPVAATLHTAAAHQDEVTLAEMHTVLTSAEDVLPIVLGVLEEAESWPAPARTAAGGELAAYATQPLLDRLAKPRRDPEDWSIAIDSPCPCLLCQELSEFLADPVRRSYEWPLAQAKRQHIHQRIESAELPVTHQTRRQGRPFTLVLRKTDALFTREATTRREDQAHLTRIQAAWA